MKSQMLKEKMFFVLTLFIILMTIVSNLMFIYGLWKTNKVLSFIQKLFIYLSIIDLLVGCVPGSMYAVYILNGSSCMYMSITMSLGLCFAILDCFTLFTISLLRLIAIRRPLKLIHYKKFMLSLMFEAIAAFSIAGASLYIYLTGNDVSEFTHIIYLYGSTLFIFNISTIICILLCLHSIQKDRNHRNLAMSTQQNLQKNRRSIITLMIIASVFMALTMVQGVTSYLIRKGLNSLQSFSSNMNSLSMIDLTVISTMLNAALNSFIYMCRSKKLRRFYVNLIKK